MTEPELSAEELELAKWWPSWRYRGDGAGGVEKQLFQHPDDVPEGEGWTDSPAKCGDEPAPDNPPDVLAPPYDQHKFHVLRLELQRRTGKGPRPGTTKVQLVAMLEATDE